jgi:hypothetical protein
VSAAVCGAAPQATAIDTHRTAAHQEPWHFAGDAESPRMITSKA